MLIIPALDIRGGRVVRLLHGDFGRETAYSADAVQRATEYAEAGARRLHVVDLDAARGGGDNRALVERVVSEVGIEVQVAGGVRSLNDARRWLDSGAAAAVMGTVAVREPDTLAAAAEALPGRILAALDVRAGRPAVSGWLEDEGRTVSATLRLWAAPPLGGVVLTSIDRDGTLEGPDLELLAGALTATSHPLTYSGGIASMEDVAAVASAGAAAAILGKSLLEGRISLSPALFGARG
ncbi:MAG: 1-(5-phosphoribosyl)-5-[(5-phosphoribosylamino)methylideneamino] imidazole-4-carboxamide isomerase [Candidatus Dormibacteraeota bacterium]|nr:1-(5-phosphoribosyl)-5-[(5-phosphoribosylamino)methylideneamino] imidazole-4-carboxamide isomerase [Candidatus Dormibacteraeota bacterium]